MLERRALLGLLLRCAVITTCLAALYSCTPCAESPQSSRISPPSSRPAPPPNAAANGITREAQDLIPPGPPGSIRVERRDGSFVVEWNGTRDDTIQGYQVFRRVSGGAWQAAGFVKLRADDEQNRGTYSYSERSDEAFEFTVAAVDARGKPGQKTCEIH